jgi:hypothetical protein
VAPCEVVALAYVLYFKCVIIVGLFQPQNECQLHDLADHVTYTISTSNRSKQVNHPEFMAEMKVPKQKVFNVTLQAANSVGVSSSSSVITVYQSSMMGKKGFYFPTVFTLWNIASEHS